MEFPYFSRIFVGCPRRGLSESFWISISANNLAISECVVRNTGIAEYLQLEGVKKKKRKINYPSRHVPRRFSHSSFSLISRGEYR